MTSCAERSLLLERGNLSCINQALSDLLSVHFVLQESKSPLCCCTGVSNALHRDARVYIFQDFTAHSLRPVQTTADHVNLHSALHQFSFMFNVLSGSPPFENNITVQLQVVETLQRNASLLPFCPVRCQHCPSTPKGKSKYCLACSLYAFFTNLSPLFSNSLLSDSIRSKLAL